MRQPAVRAWHFAVGPRLERNTKGLPTFKQRRRSAKIGDVSHAICSYAKGEVRERIYTSWYCA